VDEVINYNSGSVYRLSQGGIAGMTKPLGAYHQHQFSVAVWAFAAAVKLRCFQAGMEGFTGIGSGSRFAIRFTVNARSAGIYRTLI